MAKLTEEQRGKLKELAGFYIFPTIDRQSERRALDFYAYIEQLLDEAQKGAIVPSNDTAQAFQQGYIHGQKAGIDIATKAIENGTTPSAILSFPILEIVRHAFRMGSGGRENDTDKELIQLFIDRLKVGKLQSLDSEVK